MPLAAAGLVLADPVPQGFGMDVELLGQPTRALNDLRADRLASLEPVDLSAVKAAARPELVGYAAAAADNAMDLLDDAELLSGAGRRARAYSAAVLAIEEFGKAAGLLALALMPESLRAGAPVRRILEWHQLKQVGGLLMAIVHFGPPGLPAKLAALPDSELARILTMTETLAQDADRLKLRGLYVDMDKHGRIRRPSEVTDLEVAEQLAWARQAAWSASLLRDPGDRAWLCDPPAEAVELSRALVGALTEAGDVGSPKAASAAMLEAVCKFRRQMTASDADARPGPRAASRRWDHQE